MDLVQFINFGGRVMSFGHYKEGLERSRKVEWYSYDAAAETPRARALRQFIRQLQPRAAEAEFHKMARAIEPKVASA